MADYKLCNKTHTYQYIMPYLKMMGISAGLIVLTFNNYFWNIDKEIANSCHDVTLGTILNEVVNYFGYIDITAEEIVSH